MEVPRGMEPTGTNGRTRHTLSDPPWVGRVSSCGGFLVGWQGTLFLVVTTIGKAFDLLASVVRFPDRHDRNRSRGWFRCRPPVFRLAVHSGFAVVMAQVRRPVPFRTRKLRPGTAMVLHSRGCGRVARRRIQLSGPSGRVPCGIPGRSLFLFAQGVFLRPVGDYGRRQAGLREDSSSGWRFSDCGRPVGVLVIPVSGGIWTVRGLAAGGFLQ